LYREAFPTTLLAATSLVGTDWVAFYTFYYNLLFFSNFSFLLWYYYLLLLLFINNIIQQATAGGTAATSDQVYDQLYTTCTELAIV